MQKEAWEKKMKELVDVKIKKVDFSKRFNLEAVAKKISTRIQKFRISTPEFNSFLPNEDNIQKGCVDNYWCCCCNKELPAYGGSWVDFCNTCETVIESIIYYGFVGAFSVEMFCHWKKPANWLPARTEMGMNTPRLPTICFTVVSGKIYQRSYQGGRW